MMIFILSLIYGHIANSKIIKTTYFGEISPFTTRIDLSNIKDKFLVTTVDLTSTFTWVVPSSNRYSCNDNNNYEYFNISSLQIKARKCFGDLSLDDNSNLLLNFPHVIIDEDQSRGRGLGRSLFGFAFKFDDEEYSLIHQLYNKGVIDRRVFAIGGYNRFHDYGNIYYGGIDEKELEGKKHKGICSVSDNKATWSCELNKVLVDNRKYNFDNWTIPSSYFQTSDPIIYVPESFIEFILDTVERRHKGDCFSYTSPRNEKRVRCLNDIIDNLPNYTFIFGEYSFSLPMRFFFEPGYETSDSVLIFDPSSSSDWIFGNHFLSKFTTIFDYDNKTISFYSDKFAITKTKKTLYIKIIITVMISLMTVMIAMLLIYKYN